MARALSIFVTFAHLISGTNSSSTFDKVLRVVVED